MSDGRSSHCSSYYDGIAFALGDGFAAVELGAVFDESDYLLPWAENLVEEFATYSELAPDNEGLTLFVSGTFEGRNIEPVPHPAGGTIAVWQHDRFLCITGERWPDYANPHVEDRTNQLRHLARQLRSGVPCATGGARAPKIEEQEPEHQTASGAAGAKPQSAFAFPIPHSPLPIQSPPAKPANEVEAEADPGLADQIVELALTDFRLGRTPADETFAVPRVGPNIAHMLRGGSAPLRKALARQFRRRHGRTLNSSALSDALNVIEAEAAELEPEPVALRVAHLPRTLNPEPRTLNSDGVATEAEAAELEPEPVALRVAHLPLAPVLGGEGPGVRGNCEQNNAEDLASPSASPPLCPSVIPNPIEHSPEPESETRNNEGIVIDLGRPDGRAVIVTASGWRIVDRSPVLFRRTPLTAQLPLPVPGGRLDQLRALVNVSDEGWEMLRGWLVAGLFPSIAHTILALRGEQGTGKSTALRMLAGLVDPSAAMALSAPSDSENWITMADGGWCLPLDNVAGIAPWFSEALCRAVTGDGIVRRRRYTDGDFAVIAFRRVLALTCINLGPISEDLAARLLPVDLELIDKAARLPESQLLARFEALKPKIFGALLDEVAATLRNLPTVRLDQLPRMADFAHLLAALPSAPAVPSTLNPEPRTLNSPLSIYLRLIDRLTLEVVEGDPVAAAVSEFMSTRDTWQGTATELLSLLVRPEESRGWPKTGQYLTCRLNEIASGLRATGIVIVHTRASGFKRTRLVQLKTIPLEFQ